MRWLFSAILCAALICAPIQGAQAQRAHVPFYQQYNEALAAGDFATAAKAGEQAWRAAEGELGDNQTTAILAYNYAALIYFTMPEKAVEPLERVVAITGESNELFGAEPPELMLSYVRATAKDENRRFKTDLRRHLEAFDENSNELTLLSGRGWLHIARYDMSRNRYSVAVNSATASLRHYEPFRDFSPREYTNALMARGISNVAGTQRNNDDIIDATHDFNAAVEMFPPQTDIETFDPLLAAVIAWDVAARSAAFSDNSGAPQTGSRIRSKPPELPGIESMKWATPRPTRDQCQFVWKNRPAPEFPNSAARSGFLGAVLIGYHLDGTKVSGARILAEVPQQSEFGESTLDAVEEWELESEPLDEVCRRNIITTIQFRLK